VEAKLPEAERSETGKPIDAETRPVGPKCDESRKNRAAESTTRKVAGSSADGKTGLETSITTEPSKKDDKVRLSEY
jgi:hypothetical protein